VVTLTSNNPSLLLISATPTAAGSASIGITMLGPNAFQGTYYLQALSGSGTATYTASAPGYAPRTGTITLTPSGVILWDGSYPGNMIFGNTVIASMAQLDPAGNTFVQVQQLAGGMAPVSIDLSTDMPSATITTPVVISAGSDSTTATLTGSGYGHVTASTPSGYTTSNLQSVTVFF
ncbi:MAG: hypothetical protein JST11_30410, partial [Acidobacteria bacterium]|nr:hypothetical protein [Acidobacteriota bacterium]